MNLSTFCFSFFGFLLLFFPLKDYTHARAHVTLR